jgi:ELWxxDGT repeat protein
VDLVQSVAGVQVGNLPAGAAQFTTDGTRLYFVADDTALVSTVPGSLASDRHGSEVWVSDGTTAGTRVLDSVAVPARVGVEPGMLTPAGDPSVFGDSVFFTARALNPNGSLAAGRILWQTNDAGMSQPVLVGAGSGTIAEPGQIVAFGGTMFFVSDAGSLFWLTREFPPATVVSGEAPADGQVSGAGSNLLTFSLVGGQSDDHLSCDETQGSPPSRLVELLRTRSPPGLAGAVEAGLDAGTRH